MLKMHLSPRSVVQRLAILVTLWLVAGIAVISVQPAHASAEEIEAYAASVDSQVRQIIAESNGDLEVFHENMEDQLGAIPLTAEAIVQDGVSPSGESSILDTLPPDIFEIGIDVQWIPGQDATVPDMVTLIGIWEYRDTFAGADTPHNVSTMEYNNYDPSCWRIDDMDALATFDAYGRVTAPDHLVEEDTPWAVHTYREDSSINGNIWRVYDYFHNDSGLLATEGWHYTGIIQKFESSPGSPSQPSCPDEPTPSMVFDYSYMHAQGGSEMSVALGAFGGGVTISGAPGVDTLQKNTGLLYLTDWM